MANNNDRDGGGGGGRGGQEWRCPGCGAREFGICHPFCPERMAREVKVYEETGKWVGPVMLQDVPMTDVQREMECVARGLDKCMMDGQWIDRVMKGFKK